MSLEDLRKQIDEIDEKIVKTINERAEIVKEIGRLKNKDNTDIYVPERESIVYKKVTSHNNGPFPDSTIRAIYREIMSGSLALERPLNIAFLGPEASFSHVAAKNKFGESVKCTALADIPAVFKAVAKRHVDYGIVPIENSTDGGINDTIDMFLSTDVKIVAEVLQKISHNLLSKSAQKDIVRIYSKHTVFGQCKNWLAGTFPNAELIDTVSTTRAAEIAAREEGSAAIGSSMSSEKYGLPILFSNIEDNENNVTRFFILGPELIPRRADGNFKTSIMIGLKDHVGALHDMLIPFKDHKVNLTMIESRPSKKQVWEYYFFIDFLGYYKDESQTKVLDDLGRNTKEIKILGSYPQSDLIY